MCFGERLKYLRKNANLTQKQLAECIGLTRQAVAAYESGIREPNFEILLKIADYFEVSIDFIFGRVESTKIDAYTIAANIRLIRGKYSYSDFSKEIGNKLAVTITPEKLKLYESAKIKPDKSEIALLAKYAEKDVEFFYMNHKFSNLSKKS